MLLDMKKKHQRTGPKVDSSRHPLAEWREKQKLSIRQLSELSGIEPMTISRIERGEQFPGRQAIVALTRAIQRKTPKTDPRRVIFSIEVMMQEEE